MVDNEDERSGREAGLCRRVSSRCPGLGTAAVEARKADGNAGKQAGALRVTPCKRKEIFKACRPVKMSKELRAEVEDEKKGEEETQGLFATGLQCEGVRPREGLCTKSDLSPDPSSDARVYAAGPKLVPSRPLRPSPPFSPTAAFSTFVTLQCDCPVLRECHMYLL